MMGLYSGAGDWGVGSGGLYCTGKSLQHAFCSTYYFSFFFPILSSYFCIFHVVRRCEIYSKLPIKAAEYVKLRIRLTIDTVEVTLVSLLLTLNTFHFLLQCFYCWLWSAISSLGLLLIVLRFCVLSARINWGKVSTYGKTR